MTGRQRVGGSRQQEKALLGNTRDASSTFCRLTWLHGPSSSGPFLRGGFFLRTLDSRVSMGVISFHFEDGQFVDQSTGTAWNSLGKAVAGPRTGEYLSPVISVNHFWFSWVAFRPETRIYHAASPLAPEGHHYPHREGGSWGCANGWR